MRTLRVWPVFAALLASPLPAAHANPILGLLAHLHAADEVPAVLSPAGGAFHGTLAVVQNQFAYRLHYFGLEGAPIEIDLHLAQPGANGGVMVVLCSNLPTAAPGTQPCPAPPATISGPIQSADIVAGAAAQGVAAGDLNAFAQAINANLAYVNIHTDRFPAGEARGQISVSVLSPD
jgi:hypothetical protein